MCMGLWEELILKIQFMLRKINQLLKKISSFALDGLSFISQD